MTTPEEIARADAWRTDRAFIMPKYKAWKYKKTNPAVLAEYAAHVTAEKDKEIERLRDLADKYKWQVRDTYTRAEKAEAEVRKIRDTLAASDVASVPKDYTVPQMAMDRMAELERLRATTAEKGKEIERLREALIDCGRIARAFVADDVSTDFLMTVPAEVRARITTLKAVADAARVFRELYEMEDANANDVGGGLEDLFAALDGEKADG